MHTEKRCCSKSVLVQLCEQVQSVRHICCVLCKSVSGQMPFEQLSSYSTLQTPDGFYKHCTPASSLTWLQMSVGQPASFRSAFRMNKVTITSAVWQSLLNTRHSSSNQILKSLILQSISVFPVHRFGTSEHLDGVLILCQVQTDESLKSLNF